MIFTEIDRKTMQTLCTLVKIAEPQGARRDAIVNVGQFLGVPKDDTLELIDEWDEHDTFEFVSVEEKKHFVQDCFSYMAEDYHPKKSEKELYEHVVSRLGLASSARN